MFFKAGYCTNVLVYRSYQHWEILAISITAILIWIISASPLPLYCYIFLCFNPQPTGNPYSCCPGGQPSGQLPQPDPRGWTPSHPHLHWSQRRYGRPHHRCLPSSSPLCCLLIAPSTAVFVPVKCVLHMLCIGACTSTTHCQWDGGLFMGVQRWSCNEPGSVLIIISSRYLICEVIILTSPLVHTPTCPPLSYPWFTPVHSFLFDLDSSFHPPLLPLFHPNPLLDYAVEERPSEIVLMHQLEEGGPDPLVFVLNANLLAMVKLVNCESLCQCYQPFNCVLK